MGAPDHPQLRIASNAARYATNYMTAMFLGGLAMAFTHHPIKILVLIVAEVTALMAPPEVFDIQVLRKSAFVDIGGPKVRLLVLIYSHGALWAFCFLARGGGRGQVVALLACLAHAYFRKRPWTDMAKDKFNEAKEKLTTKPKAS